MCRSVVATCVLLLLAVPAPAAKTTIEFTVDAGKFARANDPVTVPLTLPKEFDKVQTVALRTGKDAVEIVGQLTAPGIGFDEKPSAEGKVARELHFILPTLPAGASATFTAVIDTDVPDVKVGKDKVFHWTDTKGAALELDFGSMPVLRYEYKALDTSSKEKREETFKVYHHLFDPTGKHLVTKGPGGLYTHHRGIFYGFKDVTYGDNKKVDIWHCTKDTYQEHEKILSAEAGPVLGRHRVQIAWHGTTKDVFAHEERELTVYHLPGGTFVEFASRLKSTGGTVKLDGDPQHAGFHFRAAQEVADKTKAETTYTRPDGADEPGKTRNWPDKKDHVNLPWDAMSFVLGGQRYTVAYLDHPNNPKEARFSERDYGRFGSYFVTDVTEAKPLTVRYRLWLQAGTLSVAEAAALHNEFVTPVKVTVK